MIDGRTESQAWIDDELAGSRFGDVRLGRHLRQLVTQMAGAIGGPIPLACQDWANTKAAYRFLSNADVSEGKILHGHFQSTASRVAAVDGPILVLQDTTEFSYERKKPEQVGAICYAPSKRETVGIVRVRAGCPRLDPRNAHRLQLCDDPGGHLVIEIDPFGLRCIGTLRAARAT